MITLTEKQFNSIPKDYRMIWTNPSNPEYIGKKAALEGSLLAAAGMKQEKYEIALLIEDIHFKIIPEEKTETIPPTQHDITTNATAMPETPASAMPTQASKHTPRFPIQSGRTSPHHYLPNNVNTDWLPYFVQNCKRFSPKIYFL